MVRLALRFISGKYKGGEYVLSQKNETLVGRSSNIDLVLMEDMVSRKHARIWIEDDAVQMGLTRNEIRSIWRQLERLLGDLDDGKIKTF